jgi:hypothetical protein
LLTNAVLYIRERCQLLIDVVHVASKKKIQFLYSLAPYFPGNLSEPIQR